MTNRTSSTERKSPIRRVGEVFTATSAAIALAIGLAACSSAEANNTDPIHKDPKATSETATPTPKETSNTENSPIFWANLNKGIITRGDMPSALQPLADMSPDHYRVKVASDINQALNYLDYLYNRKDMNGLINKYFTGNLYTERIDLAADSTADQVWGDYQTSAMLALTLTKEPAPDADNKTCGPMDKDNVYKAIASYTNFYGNSPGNDTSYFSKEVDDALDASALNNYGGDLALCPTLVVASGIYSSEYMHINNTSETTADVNGSKYKAYTYTYTRDGSPDTYTKTLANVPYTALDGSTKYRAIETNFTDSVQ